MLTRLACLWNISTNESQALSLLDTEIGNREILMSVAPIRLVSIGDCMAVCLLQNRESSWDIDCILDPNVAAVDEYAEDFRAAVAEVSIQQGLSSKWLNRGLKPLFTGLSEWTCF